MIFPADADDYHAFNYALVKNRKEILVIYLELVT